MADLFTEEGFEGTFPPSGFSAAGAGSANVVKSTAFFKFGAACLRSTQTAQAGWLTYNITDGTTMVLRCYIARHTTPGTCGFIELVNANGSAYFYVTSSNTLRASWAGSTNVTRAGAITIDQFYRIDARITTGTGTALIEWEVDGTAQTDCSRAQTSANMTAFNVGSMTTANSDFMIDQIKLTNTSGDYPLGDYVEPSTSFDQMGLSGMIGL